MINLGSIQLPINSATKAFAALAKRGAGKTYLGGVMAEEFYNNGIPFVAVDPIDVWYGLKLSANGKEKGLPVVVFGKEHADIPLTREMGREIARAIVKENVSCVISTFGMPKTQQRYLIAEFAEELLNINNTPRHILIEEAHEFLPQRVFGGLGTVFNAVSNLIVMGRNRGLGVTLLNQRAATLNKDVLTQVDAIIALRSVGPQDKKALAAYAEHYGTEQDEKFNQFIDSLPGLPTGEGWIWSPEFLGKFERIKIRKRETFHPDREKIGEEFVMPVLDQTDVQSFIAKFSKSLEKGKTKSDKKIVVPAIETVEPQSLIALRNEYESKLLQKDVEIRKLLSLMEQVKNILGEQSGNGQSQVINVSRNPNSNLQFWLDKTGKGGEGKIFKFLADHAPNRFTRVQIAFAVGLSPNNHSLSTYFANLKKRALILEENKMLWLNPEI